MNIFLLVFVIGLVIALIFLNIYFRMKIIKDYKYLVKNKIEFTTGHIFNKSKMEEEIIPRYPKHADRIRLFSDHIRYSLKWALGIILVLTILGICLKFTQ